MNDIEYDDCGVETQSSWARRRVARRRELIGIALGSASMCWSETPKGVFESDKCLEILEQLLKDLASCP